MKNMGTIENDNKIWVVRAKNAFYLINNSFKWARLMWKKTHKSVYNNSTNLIKLHWNDDKYHWKNWTPNAGDINLSSFQVKKKTYREWKKEREGKSFPFVSISLFFFFSVCLSLTFCLRFSLRERALEKDEGASGERRCLKNQDHLL